MIDQQFQIIEIDAYGNESVLPLLYDAPKARIARIELETDNPDNQYCIRRYPTH